MVRFEAVVLSVVVAPSLRSIGKAYAYVTRPGTDEILVFRHPDPVAGIQIPKGTVDPGEEPRAAVVRELREESGLDASRPVVHLASDSWSHPTKPKIYRRHFFHLVVAEERDAWHHTVTGGGEDDGMAFSYFWADPGEVELVADMGDYLHRIS